MSGSDPWTILGIPQATWMSGTFVPTPAQWDQLFVAKADSAGTTTNDNATPGTVGEYVSAQQIAGVPLTTATPANITSISLTPGDWDVGGNCYLSATSGGTTFATAISIVSAALPPPATAPVFGFAQIQTAGGFAAAMCLATGSVRISIAAATTVFLVASVTFPAGTASGSGVIYARRRR